MKLRPFLLALSLPLPFAVTAHSAPAAKPNILFILADDLGVDGVSCYEGGAHNTPNADKLADIHPVGVETKREMRKQKSVEKNKS
ncbi:MAG: hypothetical protein ABIP20_10995 [Chthoniobacteraceae bacterium]